MLLKELLAISEASKADEIKIKHHEQRFSEYKDSHPEIAKLHKKAIDSIKSKGYFPHSQEISHNADIETGKIKSK